MTCLKYRKPVLKKFLLTNTLINEKYHADTIFILSHLHALCGVAYDRQASMAAYALNPYR